MDYCVSNVNKVSLQIYDIRIYLLFLFEMDKPYLFYSRFLVVSKDVHELTVCHGPVNGPFESNVIFRGFSRSYLLPLPVQISSVLSSACKSEKSTCLKQNEAAIATDIYLQIITTVQGNLIKFGNGHKTNETITKKQNYLHHSTFCYSSQFCFLKSSP